MDRPDDITGAEWAAAGGLLRNAVLWRPNAAQESIARALMAAEARGMAEEREACAKLAVRNAPATQDWDDAPLQDLALRIAAAIRKRSEAV